MTKSDSTYRYNRGKILLGKQQEFLGILKGALADDVIVAPEVTFIIKWLDNNLMIQDTWPAKAVQECILRAMEGGNLGANELDDIQDLIKKIVPPLREDYNTDLPSAPWDEDNFVELKKSICVLTGQFLSGEKEDLERDIASCGGTVKSNVSRKIDYLFVGHLGNQQWTHSNFGRKIEKAIKLKESGEKIKILHEEVLFESINMARS